MSVQHGETSPPVRQKGEYNPENRETTGFLSIIRKRGATWDFEQKILIKRGQQNACVFKNLETETGGTICTFSREIEDGRREEFFVYLHLDNDSKR